MSEGKRSKKSKKIGQEDLEQKMRPKTLLEIDPTLAFKKVDQFPDEKEKWWHPHITDDEAREALSGCKPKTFLIRPSSQVPNYAVSYVEPNGKIRKVLIINDDQGFHLDGYKDEGRDIDFYKTMQDLVDHNGSILKYPLNRRQAKANREQEGSK